MKKPIFPWDSEHQTLLARRMDLTVQRSRIDAEIQRLNDEISVSDGQRMAPLMTARRQREEEAVAEAMRTGKNITFKDPEDGCEVTATVAGHIFLNAADWY